MKNQIKKALQLVIPANVFNYLLKEVLGIEPSEAWKMFRAHIAQKKAEAQGLKTQATELRTKAQELDGEAAKINQSLNLLTPFAGDDDGDGLPNPIDPNGPAQS